MERPTRTNHKEMFKFTEYNRSSQSLKTEIKYENPSTNRKSVNKI